MATVEENVKASTEDENMVSTEDACSTNEANKNESVEPVEENGGRKWTKSIRGEVVLGPDGVPLSKNQIKKMRAKERYVEHRKLKKVEERLRKKAKRKLLREAGEGEVLRRVKGRLMADSQCKLRVAIDMSFDDLMSEKDCRRCVQQLGWCYAANRRAENPVQYHVVGFDGKSREVYDSIESNQNQDIHLNKLPLEETFTKEEIVYLSAESENVLTSLDDSKVYVIGGLVDHNAHKGLCFNLSKEKGYAHARLPIDEFISMKSRKVLTINHVFEILLHFTSNADWKQSFLAIIPKRKGLEDKESATEDGEKDDECPEASVESQ